MNRLAGEKGCGFKVSNQQKPCTTGVDIATFQMKLKQFASIDECLPRYLKCVQYNISQFSSISLFPCNSTGLSTSIKVGFVDAEGQGDRDAAYDARIACPVLLSAKCVLFNWRDSLQKDRMLDLLGVMCRAAQTVSNETTKKPGSDDGKEKEAKPFGHLHIVFRDWNFDGDEVRDYLLPIFFYFTCELIYLLFCFHLLIEGICVCSIVWVGK